MSTQQPTPLGRCPRCGVDVATTDVLIEYESADGRPAVWAECPNCTEVVHPDPTRATDGGERR